MSVASIIQSIFQRQTEINRQWLDPAAEHDPQLLDRLIGDQRSLDQEWKQLGVLVSETEPPMSAIRSELSSDVVDFG